MEILESLRSTAKCAKDFSLTNIETRIYLLSSQFLRIPRILPQKVHDLREIFRHVGMLKRLFQQTEVDIAETKKIVDLLETMFLEVMASVYLGKISDVSRLIVKSERIDIDLMETMRAIIIEDLFNGAETLPLDYFKSELFPKLENFGFVKSFYLEGLIENSLCIENRDWACKEYVMDLCYILFSNPQIFIHHQYLNSICNQIQFNQLKRWKSLESQRLNKLSLKDINKIKNRLSPNLYDKNLELKVSRDEKGPDGQAIKTLFLPLDSRFLITPIGMENSPRSTADRLVIAGRLKQNISELDILIDPTFRAYSTLHFLIVCGSDGYYLLDASTSIATRSSISIGIGFRIDKLTLKEGMMIRLGVIKMIHIQSIRRETIGGVRGIIFSIECISGIQFTNKDMFVAPGKEPYLIHREDQNDLAEKYVGRKHAIIKYENNELIFEHHPECTVASWILLKNREEYRFGYPSKIKKFKNDK